MAPEACNFIQKETSTQMFPCKFYQIFKNTFIIEHPQATASGQIIVVFSPNTGNEYGPEITPYLDTFHVMV